MTTSEVPALAGVHHLALPVTNLARSRERYRGHPGCHGEQELAEKGKLTGCAMAHPSGGPRPARRLDPERARTAAGLGYFCPSVPGNAAIDNLASTGLAGLGGLNGFDLASRRVTPRLGDARQAAMSPSPAAGPVIVQQRRSIMVAAQRIQVGMIHVPAAQPVTTTGPALRCTS